MAEILNLRQWRKAKARASKRAAGDENAVRFGRSTTEKALETARAEKAAADHSAHRRMPPEPDPQATPGTADRSAGGKDGNDTAPDVAR